jgi:hypothetical protein
VRGLGLGEPFVGSASIIGLAAGVSNTTRYIVGSRPFVIVMVEAVMIGVLDGFGTTFTVRTATAGASALEEFNRGRPVLSSQLINETRTWVMEQYVEGYSHNVLVQVTNATSGARSYGVAVTIRGLVAGESGRDPLGGGFVE